MKCFISNKTLPHVLLPTGMIVFFISVSTVQFHISKLYEFTHIGQQKSPIKQCIQSIDYLFITFKFCDYRPLYVAPNTFKLLSVVVIQFRMQIRTKPLLDHMVCVCVWVSASFITYSLLRVNRDNFCHFTSYSFNQDYRMPLKRTPNQANSMQFQTV